MTHEHYIVSAQSIQKLNDAIESAQKEGFVTVGSHTAVILNAQITMGGTRTHNDVEYSQSMTRPIYEEGKKSENYSCD